MLIGSTVAILLKKGGFIVENGNNVMILAQEILKRAAQVSLSDFKPPMELMKKKKEMTEVGELPEDLKRLFAVMIMVAEERGRFDDEELRKTPDLIKRVEACDESVVPLRLKWWRLKMMGELVNMMFWCSVKAHFAEAVQNKNFKICTGYKFCVTSSNSGQSICSDNTHSLGALMSMLSM